MKFFFKIVILFLIMFNFRVPGFYNSAFVAMIICTFYYIGNRKAIPLTYLFQRYSAVILIGTVILAFYIVLIVFFHHSGDVMITREKRTWVMFMMLGATVYVMPLLVEGKESTAFEELALIICYAFALQGALDLAAYLYTPLGDLFIKLKPEDALLFEDDSEIGNRYRYCNLSGTRLVELSASFGVSFIVFYLVQTKYKHQMKGWIKYFVFFFIFLGTMFSGRTGFIGFLVGLAGWLIFSYNRIFRFLIRNLKYIIGFTALLLFVFYGLFTPKQRESFTDGVFPFAFEWYYNYRDYGKFEVASAEATPMHYFYIYDKTLTAGDGADAWNGTVYPHSDAGYMNTLVLGGIPFLLVLIIYQLLYFVRPIEAALNNRSIREPNKDWKSIVFLSLLCIYIFIIEIKASMVGYLHVIEVMYLALGSSYLIQYYTQKESGESTG